MNGVDLTARAALLEQLLMASSVGMAALDQQFRYVLWNAEMERISGLTENDVIGKCAFDLFPFLAETGEDELLRSAAAGRCVASKNRPFRVEGTRRSGIYEAEYSPWRGTQGEQLGVTAIVREVTGARHAEQQLQETESRFKNMADVAPVLLWMSRADGMCTFFNQTWLNFTGRTMEEEWGVGWAECVHFEDLQACLDEYAEAFGRREVFEMEYRLKRHDGAYRWILDRGTPRYTPDGTFSGYIGSCVDITDRKQLEQDLRNAIRVRDEFLAIASHELRTPLTTVSLQLESLKRTLEKQRDETTQARLLKNAEKAMEKAQHLDRMIGAMLDVTRLTRANLLLDPQEFDLRELVEEVAERFRQSATQSGCELQLDIDSEHPGRWDRMRLEQVVTNLLTNAIKFGAHKPIGVCLRSSENYVEVTVKDHGLGIAAEYRPLLFQRFTRFVSAKNYGGLGLGLWISKEIVNAHGGDIRVHSELGKGTTFVVRLPIAASHSAPERNERAR